MGTLYTGSSVRAGCQNPLSVSLCHLRNRTFNGAGSKRRDKKLFDQKRTGGSLTAVGSENTMSLGKYYESGGAGLISTVEDYIKFADMLASGGIGYNGYRILKEDTVNIMRSGRMKNLHINNSFTCIQGGDYDYGCGVRVRTKPTEWGLPKGEFGWDGAAGSYLMVDSVNRISVVIGMNLLLWTDVFMGKHLEIVKAVYDEIV